MPRTPRRLPGSRKYRDFTDETLAKAVQDIKDNNLSLRQAATKYGISKSTLSNKIRDKHNKKTGAPCVLSEIEENLIVKSVVKSGEWGFPLDLFDLRCLVKAYLDRRGIIVNKFRNNLPGEDWAYGFMKRHDSEMRRRTAGNIVPSRAKVTPECIKAYFTNLETSIEGVTSANIFNYDESNISDDPGKKKAFFKRGVKYLERVIHHSKSAITFMMCIAGDGTFLPPYIVYRSEHLWDTWTTGGPKGYPLCAQPCCELGTRYGRTHHGWFNNVTFEDWFFSCFLPHAKRLEGTKVLIGDNLSSHFSPAVLNACEEHNIRFICLPPFSTNLTQPLDVAVFGPLKKVWRKILQKWKMDHRGTQGLPKDQFPKLFKLLIQESGSNLHENARSGFKTCGIVPFDQEAVLKKMPHAENVEPEPEEISATLEASLNDMFKRIRYGDKAQRKQSKKRLDVEPGKSITGVDSASEEEEDNYSVHDTSSGSISDLDVLAEDDVNIGASTSSNTEAHSVPDCSSNNEDANEDSLDLKESDFIIANFPGKKRMLKYVCIVQYVRKYNDTTELTVLGLKSINSKKTVFKSVPDDISEIYLEDVVEKLPEPEITAKNESILYKFSNSLDVTG